MGLVIGSIKSCSLLQFIIMSFCPCSLTKTGLKCRRLSILRTLADIKLRVCRSNIYEDVLDNYGSDPTLQMNDLDVEFVGEPGVDANGLKREMFSLFWVEAFNKLFDGGIEVVPIVDPASSATFKCLGVISPMATSSLVSILSTLLKQCLPSYWSQVVVSRAVMTFCFLQC